MRRITTILLLMMTLLLVQTNNSIKAYWNEQTQKYYNYTILIGEWDQFSNPWNSDYNLNIWEDENNLNQNIPENTIFSYNGLLYIKKPNVTYNPYYHGLPNSSIPWAAVSIDLEWRSGTNYRVNSVVTRNSRWFIANYLYNSTDWFVNDPLLYHTYTWSEWREIEPLLDSDFDYFTGTTIKDYTIDPSKVTYK